MTLQVTATGTAPLSYQWKRNGADIAGATAATYSIPAVTWDDNAAVFSVTVANSVLPAGVSSTGARLSMRPSTAGLVCSGTGSSNWCWASPQPTGLRLSSIVNVGSTLVATSFEGAIIRSTDGGVTWTFTSTPSGQRYNSVTFATASVGIAVGESGSIARTTDGGLTWTAVSSSITGLLRGVAFANPSVGVIAGGSPDSVLRTTDGGVSWTEVRVGTGLPSPSVIAFNGNGGGVLIGQESAHLTSDNGVTWTPVSLYVGYLLRTVTYASSDVVLVASGGGFYRSTDGGRTWATVSLPIVVSQVTSIAFQTATTGVAVTMQGGVIRTVDAGATWTIVVPDNPALLAGLEGVAIRADGSAVAVGANGVTLRSSDAGLTWTSWPERLASYWNAVAFGDERYGIAVGTSSSGAAIARTADGGRTWMAVNAGDSDFAAAAFATPVIAVAVGNTIRRTADAGATWSAVTAPARTGTLYGVTFLSPTVGVAVGAFDTTILRTTDAGATWTSVTPTQPVGPMFAVAAIDSTRVLAVGHFGGVLSVDGGMTWNALPAASGIGMQLRGVAFGDAGRGMAVSLDGVVVYSTDAGATWRASTSATKLPSGNGVALKSRSGLVVGWSTSEAGTRYGVMQTTTDAGGLLTTIPSFPNYPLRAVAMPSPDVGVVVSESGGIAISNGGN